MKKYILLLITILISSLISFCQVTTYVRYKNDKTFMPVANIYATKAIQSKCKITMFSLVNGGLLNSPSINYGFSELLIGFTYTPRKWLTFGFSAGIENSSTVFRFGTSLWLGYKQHSFLGLAEKGGGVGNYFYKVTYEYQAKKNIFFGATMWRFHGLGGIVGYKLKKNISFWTVPYIFDFEDKKSGTVFGATYKFE
jgi:hypothetical protein